MNKKPDAIKIIQWTLAIAVLLLGVYMSWGGKTKWIVIGNLVHALPLISLLLPWQKLRMTMLWFGVFLILQDGYTLYTNKTELYKTLPYTMNNSFNVTGDILRGIDGMQHVTTDEKGFRVTKDIDYGADTPYRIFAIGASTTEQIYLDDHKTWTHLLQEELDNIEVINTGVSGLRAEHHLATLNNILPLNPDMIIFLTGVNDWNKHVRENFGSRHYQRNKFRYSLTPVAIRDFLRDIRSARKHKQRQSTNDGIREENGDYYRDKMGSLNRERVETWRPAQVDLHYVETMQKVAVICQREKIKCVLLSQPHGYTLDVSDDYKSHFWMTPPGEKLTLDLPSLTYVADLYNGWLESFACENSLYFYDLAAQIPAGFDSFYDDVHFNEEGARRVATALSPEIQKAINAEKPLPCE